MAGPVPFGQPHLGEMTDGHDRVRGPGHGQAGPGLPAGPVRGRVMKTGEHLVPEAALEALADQNIPFSVKAIQGRQTNRRLLQ